MKQSEFSGGLPFIHGKTGYRMVSYKNNLLQIHEDNGGLSFSQRKAGC